MTVNGERTAIPPLQLSAGNHLEIWSKAGDDVINVFSNTSVPPLDIYSGKGHDRIQLNAELTQAVRIWGNAGNDVISAKVYAGFFDDPQGSHVTVFGCLGNDKITVESTFATLFGGGGDDTLIGGSRGDVLHGEEGDDRLEGGAGNDRLFGNAGRDTLIGGDGSDLLNGGPGQDQLFPNAAPARRGRRSLQQS